MGDDDSGCVDDFYVDHYGVNENEDDDGDSDYDNSCGDDFDEDDGVMIPVYNGDEDGDGDYDSSCDDDFDDEYHDVVG